MFLIPYFYAFRLTFNCWFFFLSTITIVFCNLNVILIFFLKSKLLKNISFICLLKKSLNALNVHIGMIEFALMFCQSAEHYIKKRTKITMNVSNLHTIYQNFILLYLPIFSSFFFCCWPPTGLKIIQCTHILNRSLSSTNNTNQALRKTNKPINSYRVPFTTSVLTLEFLNFYYHSVYLSYAQDGESLLIN